MVVRTQLTGANPRAKIVRSHTLAFVGVRARIGSVNANQNEERSDSGNVFRLGQGQDLRDTLNRRQDHEQSQQSTAHNMRLELAPKRQGEIPIENLHRAIPAMKENDVELIAAVTGSSFNQEIREARLLKGFKLPAIKVYEGKSDPQEHLDHFNNLMELHLVSKMTKCGVFAVTLIGGAKKWLKVVPLDRSLVGST